MGFIKIRKKIHVLVIALFILPAIPMAAYALPAFSGAQGWGSDTIGGRSPSAKLYKVNTTADNSNPPSCVGNICTSSLRSALAASGPRFIIFTVGGTIQFTQGAVSVNSGNLTIAGQTAPGGGILLRDRGIDLYADDIIIRGLRLRRGPAYYAGNENTSSNIGIWGGRNNIVIDHNSFSWTPDEMVTLWGHPDAIYKNITLSWNIFAEGLVAPYGGHGTLIGDGLSLANPSYNISLHHNLYANVEDRNPRLKGCTQAEIINNLGYNWGFYPGTTMSRSVWVGNHYIKGPNTTSGDWGIDFLTPNYCTPFPDASVYLSNNIGPGRPTNTGDEWNIAYGGPSGPWAPKRTNTPPFSLGNVVADDVNDVKSKLLSGAGATVPYRDSVDIRQINDVNNLTGRFISDPSAVGGWPTIATGTYPTDADGDGMPDTWETARGLNPNDPSDWNKDRDGDGYLNIEEYINSFFPAVISSLPPPITLIPNPPSIIRID